MVNTKGGKNYKKGKKHAGPTKKTETPWADDATMIYAQVKRKLGGNRIEAECNDGVLRQGIIPGSFYKRVWMNIGDVILLQLSELDNKEGFILYKYDPNEINFLKNQDKLKFETNANEDGGNFQFGDESEEEDNVDDIADEVEKAHTSSKTTTIPTKAEKIEKERKRQESILKKNEKDDEEVDIDDI
jgi:translation initiation factor 1A